MLMFNGKDSLSYKTTKQRISAKDIFIILLITIPLMKSQLVVGSLVNAILFFSVYFLGTKKTLPLIFIPCLISLFSGLMPIVFLVPFIIFSNFLLISIFDKYKNNLLNAVFLAAIGKAIFFFILLFIFPVYGYIFGVTQFITALLGGFIFLKGKNYLA